MLHSSTSAERKGRIQFVEWATTHWLITSHARGVQITLGGFHEKPKKNNSMFGLHIWLIFRPTQQHLINYLVKQRWKSCELDEPVRDILSSICANSWPKRRYYSYFRNFTRIFEIFMLILCILHIFCANLSEAESTSVLIHTLLAYLGSNHSSFKMVMRIRLSVSVGYSMIESGYSMIYYMIESGSYKKEDPTTHWLMTSHAAGAQITLRGFRHPQGTHLHVGSHLGFSSS